ncbi:hypothetical protein HK098_007282 [Nowakowskiella sp. JEL0407]|nr:hypothetical protein HK098_007282 [Nowakowskiella sp. JEL0407]
MVEASFWILNSHLAKIDHDLTKRTAVVRAGDEGLRFFKNTFFYLLHRGDPASIYHLTLYFVDQLVSCGLYHHVREVWKSYRKAGIRFPGHKLDKHRNTFIIDENGDKVHVIAGFNDVIMDY